jgi:hypothetical protein
MIGLDRYIWQKLVGAIADTYPSLLRSAKESEQGEVGWNNLFGMKCSRHLQLARIVFHGTLITAHPLVTSHTIADKYLTPEPSKAIPSSSPLERIHVHIKHQPASP